MPFDAPTGKASFSLPDIMRDLNLKPIPRTVLDAHKVAQRRKHPGGHVLGYFKEGHVDTILSSIFVGSLVLVLLSVTMIGVYITTPLSMGFILGWVGVAIGCGSTLGLMQWTKVNREIKRPARWVEDRYTMRSLSLDVQVDKMPSKVADRINEIRALLPSGTVIIGTLMQSSFILDPYAIIEDENGNQAIIAIWEDDEIIQIS
jgi:hypothetical protein